MKIELIRPYKSITTLTTDNLPDFAVLIGRNGVGKTQILQALDEGAAAIPGIGNAESEFYDMVSFHSPNSTQANLASYQFAQSTADAFLLPQSGSPPLIEIAAAVFNRFTSDIERDSGAEARDAFVRRLRDEARSLPAFSVYGSNHTESSYMKRIHEQVLTAVDPGNMGRRGSRTTSQYRNSFHGSPAALLVTAMMLSEKLPHELTRPDIMRASNCEGDTLANDLSAVFTNYKFDQFIWTHEQFDNDIDPVSRRELIQEYRANYPPPWETLRNILSEMREAAGDEGLFAFEFSAPAEHELRMSNYDQFSFETVMTNRTTGAQYDLDSLSSGEKILMSLCLASFNQYLGRPPPKILLLDELDALLHPSMVAVLVRTLKALFVSKGTKVLMTSHSALTVAALDESEIFRVVRIGSQITVTRTTKSESINELSEGLATVDVGLRIAAYDEAKVTILTEGNNAKHLKRWVALNFPNDVRVSDELGEHSNDKQLLAYGRLLAKMNTNTYFVIVWDCDSAGKASALRNELTDGSKVTPFAFTKREDNTIAARGIENNYDDEILEQYSTRTVDSDGALLGRGFQNSRKTEFANHVLQHGTPEYFTNYRGLYDIVSALLESPMKQHCLDAPEQ